jgi:hypothetical protein
MRRSTGKDPDLDHVVSTRKRLTQDLNIPFLPPRQLAMRRQPRISREMHQSVHVEQIVPHPGIDRAVCLQCRNIIFKVNAMYVEVSTPPSQPVSEK